jgi:hypothetical protein
MEKPPIGGSVGVSIDQCQYLFNLQTWSVIFASIAGVTRSVEWMRAKS